MTFNRSNCCCLLFIFCFPFLSCHQKEIVGPQGAQGAHRYVHETKDPVSDYIYVGDGGLYIDPQTGKIISPNLSPPSNILKFVY
jgi:hypothetical protein